MDVLDFYVGGENDADGTSQARDRNGRLTMCDAAGCPRATPYGLFTDSGRTTGADGVMLDSLRHVDIATSEVALVFFARENVDALQLALRRGVNTASGRENIVVGRQSDVELGIIMRSRYFSETRKHSMSLAQHVAYLNREVLAFCIPTVLNEARMYLAYRHSIERMPVPIDRGVVESMKGSRQI